MSSVFATRGVASPGGGRNAVTAGVALSPTSTSPNVPRRRRSVDGDGRRHGGRRPRRTVAKGQAWSCSPSGEALSRQGRA